MNTVAKINTATAQPAGTIDPVEWETRVDLAACYRLVDHFGMTDLHLNHISARVPGNAGIEANARQFVPSANAPWEARFPGLFTIRDGSMNTGQLTGPGLGAVPAGGGRASNSNGPTPNSQNGVFASSR